ncbi:MAG: ferredoxin [Planctomycetes bacterium]|jgi:ferredoxin|nr:ferredoxin [Planctomycetota bacterium]
MPTVTFSHTGATLEVEPGGSFLTACEDSDAPADFGCQSGACGVCTLVVEQGAGNLIPGTEEELEVASQFSSEATARLGCQVVVNGDITVRPA